MMIGNIKARLARPPYHYAVADLKVADDELVFREAMTRAASR